MAKLDLSSTSLLSLLQWCDTLFPSGAFSHSFGLESATQSGKVKNGDDLFDWIRSKLRHQLFPCDLVFISRSHRASHARDFTKLQAMDASFFSLRLPREIREGGQMIASRLIQTAAKLYPSPFTKEVEKLYISGRLKGDPAIAFGMFAAASNIPVEPALLGYLYMFISGQVSAGLRLISIGQQEGQTIIQTLIEWVSQDEKVAKVDQTEKEVSSFMPALEIASMQHEVSTLRLFQS